MVAKDDRIERGGHKGTVKRVYDDGLALVAFDGGSQANVPVADLSPAVEDKTWPPTDLETK